MWHTKPYKLNMCYNKVEYSTSTGPYFKTHDAKVTFCMPYFSSSNTILHRFHIDKNEGKSGIDCNMIIWCDTMLHLGILEDLKIQSVQWDGATVLMKETRGLIRQTYLTSSEMREVVLQTAEPVSNR